jgi:glycogen phosphorylase
VILKIDGVRILRALRYESIERFHMNEGHASLLTVELAHEEAGKAGEKVTRETIDAVKRKCIFTTHTPVPAGHDQFPRDLMTRVLGRPEDLFDLDDVAVSGLRDRVVNRGDGVNMTFLALNFSHYVNGVAKKHGEVSRLMFANYSIDAITNGVHAGTWVAPPFQELYDRFMPGWKQDNFNLRYAMSIPCEEVWKSHEQAKRGLIDYANRETNAGLDIHLPTIGFARRAATYKRGDLLFADLERLKDIARTAGPFQVIYAGKAHPKDEEGKKVIQRIIQTKESLRRHIKVAYLENYDMAVGKLMTSGVDVWLNTPQPPMEASGTSGMKSALNGVPSLSVLDGWWIEGHIEGVTGWSVGEKGDTDHDSARHAASLYGKLENVILPMFNQDRHAFIDIMRHCIALNGAFFNTQRMMQQYVVNAYFR